jgi:hypothetical protein
LVETGCATTSLLPFTPEAEFELPHAVMPAMAEMVPASAPSRRSRPRLAGRTISVPGIVVALSICFPRRPLDPSRLFQS